MSLKLFKYASPLAKNKIFTTFNDYYHGNLSKQQKHHANAKITTFCTGFVIINNVEFALGQPINVELSYKLLYKNACHGTIFLLETFSKCE